VADFQQLHPKVPTDVREGQKVAQTEKNDFSEWTQKIKNQI